MFSNLHLPQSEKPPCVLVLHGLESHKDGGKWPILAAALCKAGFACFRFNFRGCGEGREQSQGHFKDTNLTNRIDDYVSTIDFLKATDKVDVNRLGVIGSSFGGMVAIAAQSHKIKAMITLGTPYTLFQYMQKLETKEEGYVLPSGKELPKAFVTDLQKYPVLNAIKKAPPILLIHGSEDKVIPMNHAYHLYASANEPKKLTIITGADHAFSQSKYLKKIISLSTNWYKKWLAS